MCWVGTFSGTHPCLFVKAIPKMSKFFVSLISASVFALAVAGCSGGSAMGVNPIGATHISIPVVSPSIVSSRTSSAKFTIKIPAASKTASNLRRTKYVSSGTQSVKFALTTVNGVSSVSLPIVVSLTEASPNCSSSPLVCTVLIPNIVIGNDTFSVTTYASTDGSGPALSTNSTNATITANTTTDVSLTLQGVIASVVISVPNQLTAGASANVQLLAVTALDASGATIIGSDPYSNGPIVLTSDFMGITALLNLSTPESATTFSYNGDMIADNTQHIIATVGSVTARGAIPVRMPSDESTIFVANHDANTVSEFPHGATTASKTLTGLSSPIGVAVDASGTVYVANFDASTVSEFIGGATTPSKTLTGVSYPYGVAVDASGTVYVVNNGAWTVSEFVGGETTPSITLTGLYEPTQMTVDGSGTVYVADYGSNTVLEFIGGATTPSKILTGLNGPWAVAVDANGTVYVTDSSGIVSEFVGGATTVSQTISGVSIPYGIAVNARGDLYVSDAGTNKVLKFVGGATTPSKIITGLIGPEGIGIDPRTF